MSTEAASSPATVGRLDQLRLGKQVLRQQAEALLRLSESLDGEFCRAVRLVYECRGSVIVSGMGKAGLVGQKITATLASTGTPSPLPAPGRSHPRRPGPRPPDDVMLILSQSGETEEIVRLLPSLAELGVPIVAITGQADQHPGPRGRRRPRTGHAARKPARWAWPPAPAPPPCWPWATPWPWWSAG